jgi:hypothetical protein
MCICMSTAIQPLCTYHSHLLFNEAEYGFGSFMRVCAERATQPLNLIGTLA